ncbi:hypothetical protein AB0F92_27455 [Kitasatospora aureofaciens]|uniref:hypothetical protein n=1 Tax=Kitasatospora aureofaciens TaxID=1894 RepID=UPI0033DBFBE9
MKPTDPRVRYYTEAQIKTLIIEVHERGLKFGLVWPSATTDTTLDGRVLVRFNTAPVTTLLNLLNLLLGAERGDPCDS